MKCFKDKVKKLVEKIPAPMEDPLTALDKAFERWNGAAAVEELRIQPVGRSAMIDLLKTLGNSSAFGHDTMDSFTLKIVAEIVVTPICHIVN